MADACALLDDAYAYFPLSRAGIRDVDKARATADPEARWKAWQSCLANQYLPWEKQPVVRLRG